MKLQQRMSQRVVMTPLLQQAIQLLQLSTLELEQVVRKELEERRGRARIYRERERVRLKLILRGKRLGFSLLEIRELLDLYEVGRNERAQLAMFIEMLGERRARLMQQKEDIDAVLEEIDGVERECRRRLKNESRGGKVAARAGTPDDATPSGSAEGVAD